MFKSTAIRLVTALAVALPLAASIVDTASARGFSDERLKDQIETVPNSIERLRQLTTG